LPGCWLKKGKNEIIVLDVVGPKQPVVWGQDKPELNKLQMEKTNKHNAPGDRPDLNSATPVAQGNMKSNGWVKSCKMSLMSSCTLGSFKK
jgi:beta-galactosidase